MVKRCGVLAVIAFMCALIAWGQVRDLGAVIQIRQWIGNDTWVWTLTRRGTTTVYDATARNNQTGQQSNHVFELRSFDGKTVTFYRQDAGLYNGTLSADGRTISGTTSFGGNKSEGWQATLASASPALPGSSKQPAPAARQDYEMGSSLRAKGDYRGALAALERALKKDSGFAGLWRERALTLISLGRPKDAILDFDRAIQLDPSDARYYNGRAFVKRDLKDLQGALADANRAVELDPNYSNAYSTRGNIRRDSGDMAGAMQDHSRSVEIDPNNATAWYNLADSKAQVGDTAGARDAYTHALESKIGEPFASNARKQLQSLPAATARPGAVAPPAAPQTPAAVPARPLTAVSAPASDLGITIPLSQFETSKWSQTDVLWKSPAPVSLPAANSAKPAALPENLDINHLTPVHYSAAITAAKEALRLLMGPVSTEEQKRFETKWAPLYEYPCQPVIEYFNKLNPLLNHFLDARAALHTTMIHFNDAWDEATAAAGLGDEDGVREAMAVCRVQRDAIESANARVNAIARQVQALGDPPDPLTHKARAKASHDEASKALRDLGQKGGLYWVIKDIAVRQHPRTDVTTGDYLAKYGFSSSEGFAIGTMDLLQREAGSGPHQLSASAFVEWKPMPRLIPETNPNAKSPHLTVEGAVRCTKWSTPTENAKSTWFDNTSCGYLQYGESTPELVRFEGTAKQPAVTFNRPYSGRSTGISLDVDAGGGEVIYTYIYELRRLTAEQAADFRRKTDADLRILAEDRQNAAARFGQVQAAEYAAVDEGKADAIALARANQVHFQNQLDGYRADLAANPADRDRLNYLIMVTEANLQAERDNETTMASGQWMRTHTAYDDWNFGYMAAHSQQVAHQFSRSANAQAAAQRLLKMLPEGQRYTEGEKLNDVLRKSTASGDTDATVAAVQELAEKVKQQSAQSAQVYQSAAEAGDYVVGVTQAIKTGADTAMMAFSFAPGGGLLYAGYMGATGYVEGGPVNSIVQAASAAHPVSMALVAAYDGYNSKVVDPKTGKDIGQGGISRAVVEGGKMAITAFALQKVAGGLLGRYLKGAKGNPEAPAMSQILGEAKFQSRMANGRAKVSLFKQRSERLAEGMRKNESAATIAEFRRQAEEAAKAIKCDYTAKMAINQAAKAGDPATMTRYLTMERKFMGEVQQELETRLSKTGWTKQEFRQFSNSASANKAGMDVDLGVVEPHRYLTQGGKTVSNPAWTEWRKGLSKNGESQSLFKYQEEAQEHLKQAFAQKVGGPGRSTNEAFVNFTTSIHSESYVDRAWLGRMGTPHASFDAINPRFTQQAADVTAFKIQHNPNAKPAKPDPNRLALTKDPIPDYLFFQEQCRTLVKDMNTKLIGSPNAIVASAPLARANKGVQQHMLGLRKVMDDFATNKIGPIEADRLIKERTGGQGLGSVLKEFESVLVSVPGVSSGPR